MTTTTSRGDGVQARVSGRFGIDTSQASVGQLMSEIATDLSTLLRQEVELARVELREEAVKAARAGGLLGAGAYGLHMTLLFGTLAVVFGVGSQIGYGWAALIMTGVWAVVAAVLAVRGRAQLRKVDLTPERTVETVKEDLAWVRHPIS